MMFPVNRHASELTATELLNLYDEARVERSLPNRSADRINALNDTCRELRAEIERRMAPKGCSICAARNPQWYHGLQQQQALQSQYSLQPALGSIPHGIADSQLDKGGNRQ